MRRVAALSLDGLRASLRHPVGLAKRGQRRRCGARLMTRRMCLGTAFPTKFSPKIDPSALNPVSRSHIWLYVGVLSTLRMRSDREFATRTSAAPGRSSAAASSPATMQAAVGAGGGVSWR